MPNFFDFVGENLIYVIATGAGLIFSFQDSIFKTLSTIFVFFHDILTNEINFFESK